MCAHNSVARWHTNTHKRRVDTEAVIKYFALWQAVMMLWFLWMKDERVLACVYMLSCVWLTASVELLQGGELWDAATTSAWNIDASAARPLDAAAGWKDLSNVSWTSRKYAACLFLDVSSLRGPCSILFCGSSSHSNTHPAQKWITHTHTPTFSLQLSIPKWHRKHHQSEPPSSTGIIILQ